MSILLATHVATVYAGAASKGVIRLAGTKYVGHVYNGIPIAAVGDESERLAFRDSFSLPEECVVFCSVSRISLEKGLDLLLRAYASVERGLGSGSSALIVIGDGPDLSELKALASQLNLSGVRFCGHRSDPMTYLRGSDVFVQSSLHENFSNALLEAMMCSCAIIATDVGGTREAVQGSGLLVPSGNVEALTAAMETLAFDADKRRQLGLDARQRALADFSVETMVARWESVYDQLTTA